MPMPKDLPSSPQQHDELDIRVFYITNLQLSSGHTNALAESLNSLYKKELIDKYIWANMSDVLRETAEWVSWYNNTRLHSWCDYRPPLEFERVFWEGRGQQLTAA
jgi:hypothetical protein